MNIGFTTGYLDVMSLVEKIELFNDLGCTALECSIIEYDRLTDFRASLGKVNYGRFAYRSLHAPALVGGKRFRYANDEISENILSDIEALHRKIKFETVVIHADQVDDWSVFEKFELPFAVENMDTDKKTGRTAPELKEIFDEFEGKMVLDVMHAYVNDQTTKLTKNLFEEFNDRLVQIHLSGCEGTKHVPLFKSKQDDIIRSVPALNLPIIIESVCQNPDEYKKELTYVSEALRKD